VAVLWSRSATSPSWSGCGPCGPGRDRRAGALPGRSPRIAAEIRETIARQIRETIARQIRETIARQIRETIARQIREIMARQIREIMARYDAVAAAQRAAPSRRHPLARE
jgi:hypothetical protein